MLRNYCVAAVALLCGGLCFAETIITKSGIVVQGKILRNTPDSVLMEVPLYGGIKIRRDSIKTVYDKGINVEAAEDETVLKGMQDAQKKRFDEQEERRKKAMTSQLDAPEPKDFKEPKEPKAPKEKKSEKKTLPATPTPVQPGPASPAPATPAPAHAAPVAPAPGHAAPPATPAAPPATPAAPKPPKKTGGNEQQLDPQLLRNTKLQQASA